MDDDNRPGAPRLTPEKTKAWTLALYPAAAIIGVAFLLVTNRPITTEIIGLFVGLVSAGGLQVAIKKTGDKNDESRGSNYPDDHLRSSGNSELEKDNRRRPDDSDSGNYRFVDVWSSKVVGLFAASQRTRHV